MNDLLDFSDTKPWFKADLARIIQSVHAASSFTPTQINDDYRSGFTAALISVALAIGIRPSDNFYPLPEFKRDESGQAR